MATLFIHLGRDGLPIKRDTVTEIDRLMVTLTDSTGAEVAMPIIGSVSLASEKDWNGVAVQGEKGLAPLAYYDAAEGVLAVGTGPQWIPFRADEKGRAEVNLVRAFGNDTKMPVLIVDEIDVDADLHYGQTTDTGITAAGSYPVNSYPTTVYRKAALCIKKVGAVTSWSARLVSGSGAFEQTLVTHTQAEDGDWIVSTFDFLGSIFSLEVDAIVETGGSLTYSVFLTPIGGESEVEIIGALPLPAGASTLAEQQTQTTHLSAISGKLPATLGQKAMAASLAVVLASDQASIPVVATLTASVLNIGDVDVLTVPADPFGLNADAASATGSISAKLRNIAALQLPAALAAGGGLKVEGVAGGVAVPVSIAATVTVDTELPAAAALSDTIGNPTTPMIGAAGMLWTGAVWVRHAGTIAGGALVTLAAGTGTQEVVGDVASDAPIVANPVTVGGRASATAPASVSADGDAVNSWHLLNGAQATVLTAAGALIGGDAANGLDVDVTRVPTDPFGANADAASSTGSISAKLRSISAVQLPAALAAGGGLKVEGVSGGVAITVRQGASGAGGWLVIGDVAGDAPIVSGPVTVGARASAAVPSNVSADGDAVNLWALRSGALATVLTAAGALIGGDAANGLDVDITRVPAPLNVVGGGAEATALRVTLANDSTGLLGISSIIPGVGATNLGKAEDVAHVTGDVGVMALGVRNDLATTVMTGATGRYSALATDDRARAIVVAHPARAYIQDVFTTASTAGTTLDLSHYPCKFWALQVTSVGGGPATAWSVFADFSLDGLIYKPLINHTNADGDGVIKDVPLLAVGGAFTNLRGFARLRTGAGLTLNGATNITATLVGSN